MSKSILMLLLGVLSLNLSAKVYTIDEVVDMSKTQNYEVRKKFEEVYQARKEINRKIGKLAPHINLSVLPGLNMKSTGLGVVSPFTFIGAFLGFIFPSNWFGLAESRLILEGQKRLYISAIANQVNALENLYFKIHATKEIIRIYEAQRALHQAVIDTLKQREALGVGDPETRLGAEILLIKMNNDIDLLKELSHVEHLEMAELIGVKPEEMTSFEIENLAFTPMPALDENAKTTISTKAQDRSVELVGFEYLKLAAKFSKRKRAFEFFLPAGDEEAALGFGYPAHIQIAKSQEREIQIEMDRMQARLVSTTAATLGSYETLVKVHAAKEDILAKAMKRLLIIKSKFDLSGSLDMLRYTEAMKDVIETKVDIEGVRQELASAKVGLDRLLWRGNHYKNILPTIFLLQKGELTKEQKRENRHINKAIKKGELVLPAEDYVQD